MKYNKGKVAKCKKKYVVIIKTHRIYFVFVYLFSCCFPLSLFCVVRTKKQATFGPKNNILGFDVGFSRGRCAVRAVTPSAIKTAQFCAVFGGRLQKLVTCGTIQLRLRWLAKQGYTPNLLLARKGNRQTINIYILRAITAVEGPCGGRHGV